MVGNLSFNLFQQFINFIILEPNHLSKTIQLNGENFLLIFLIVLEILYVKIYHFFKLLLDLLHLLVLLLNVCLVGLLFLLNNPLKTVDLLIFLAANLLYSLVDDWLYGLLLLDYSL